MPAHPGAARQRARRRRRSAAARRRRAGFGDPLERQRQQGVARQDRRRLVERLVVARAAAAEVVVVHRRQVVVDERIAVHELDGARRPARTSSRIGADASRRRRAPAAAGGACRAPAANSASPRPGGPGSSPAGGADARVEQMCPAPRAVPPGCPSSASCRRCVTAFVRHVRTARARAAAPSSVSTFFSAPSRMSASRGGTAPCPPRTPSGCPRAEGCRPPAGRRGRAAEPSRSSKRSGRAASLGASATCHVFATRSHDVCRLCGFCARIPFTMAIETPPARAGRAVPGLSPARRRREDLRPSVRRRPVLVVMFICNHCPYGKAVEDRLIHLAREFGRATCSSSASARTTPKLSRRRLRPAGGALARARLRLPVPARRGPGRRARLRRRVHARHLRLRPRPRLAYRGRIDDSWKDESKVKPRELADALEALSPGSGRPEAAALDGLLDQMAAQTA